MSSGGRSRGGVSEQDSRSDQTHEAGAAGCRGAARMTSVNVPDRMNELIDGMVRLVDATMGAKSAPYRESRLIPPGQKFMRAEWTCRADDYASATLTRD